MTARLDCFRYRCPPISTSTALYTPGNKIEASLNLSWKIGDFSTAVTLWGKIVRWCTWTCFKGRGYCSCAIELRRTCVFNYKVQTNGGIRGITDGMGNFLLRDTVSQKFNQ